jgi:large-conductance mechanosensitive channel
MEIFLAICLLVLGLLVGLFGYKLFKVIMPVAGLIIGASIGFTGFQGVFGTGVTSTTLAVLVAVVFGLALAGLSFAFFDIALVIFMGLAMSKKANDSQANARPKTTATRTANVVLVTPVPKTPWKPVKPIDAPMISPATGIITLNNL